MVSTTIKKINMIDNLTIDLKTITKGLLQCKESFEFQADEYTFVSRAMDNPMQRKFNVDPIEQNSTDATCVVTLKNNEISATINNLDIEADPYFPWHFSTKIEFPSFNIIGDEKEDFRMIIIPFRDMDKMSYKTHFRMEFHFYKGELSGLVFFISQSDDNYRYYESILHLYGQIV